MSWEHLEDPAQVRAACITGLRRGLEHSNPRLILGFWDEHVPTHADNLIDGLTLDDVAADLPTGASLADSFRAVHSSQALLLNCFAPLRKNGIAFPLGIQSELQVDELGRSFSTGFARTQAPRVDLVARGSSGIVAVQSKCLEYLSPTRPRFSTAYLMGPTGERAADPWYAELLRLSRRDGPDYRRLDAAQLIKQALGLANVSGAEPATLIYLYWKPLDARLSPIFEEHDDELARFAERVAGGSPRFEAINYFDLWDAWADSDDPQLRAHAAALRGRYEVPAWAWEGVQWVDGRLSNAMLLDMLEEDPEEERQRAVRAVAAAMERGMSPEDAQAGWGYRDPEEVERDGIVT